MNGSLSYILEWQESPDAVPDFGLESENTGYDPYDNPGTHKETPDEES